ncbi:MAG: adenylate kinase family protein [Verrucomicrobiales bacterium]
MKERYHTYLIVGAPGAGKGTQGRILGALPRYFHLACGDVFRSLDTRTSLGRIFVDYSSRGELVPDEASIELWKRTIHVAVESNQFKPDIDCLILDGIPRNANQAALMEDLIDVKGVFHLVCPDHGQLVTRLRKRALKENRMDDASDSVIEQRLRTYEAETQPILDYYHNKPIHRVDAQQSPTLVLQEVVTRLVEDEARGV